MATGPIDTSRADEPERSQAVLGLWLSGGGGALLILSAGLLAALTLPLGVAGVIVARRGQRALAEGRAHGHERAGRAGVVLGVVTIVLSLLAVAIYVFAFAQGTHPSSGGVDGSYIPAPGLA